jgi:glycosyltransferase involved in cell wall biosynthesis
VIDPQRPLRVLFFVEGFTDIRFVVGLAAVCDLTLAIPTRAYTSSGLKARIADSRAKLAIHEIPGGRLEFQVRSFGFLLSRAGRFDIVLAQEVTRGALNANVAGRLLGVPVVNTLALPPLEYYRCRRERGTIGLWKYLLGEAAIRFLLTANGRLASGWVALGPYLKKVARRHSRGVGEWAYYGIDTDYFCPVSTSERLKLREALHLPADAFVILLASRVSHEKDPETALSAVALARLKKLNAILLNLGGGYAEFLALAESMGLTDAGQWVIGRPAAHPMTELAGYYQAVDLVIQSSLEEGLGLSPLEALSCGIPVVATAVGGMAAQLPGRARLTPRRDAAAMAEEILWVASHQTETREVALRARDSYIVPEWGREKAFHDLETTLRTVASTGRMIPR